MVIYSSALTLLTKTITKSLLSVFNKSQPNCRPPHFCRKSIPQSWLSCMDDQVTETNTSRPGSPVDPQNDPARITPRQSQQPVYRFNWDPSLRRPGPASVSEATDNRYDVYNIPNAGEYRFSNLSSLSLAVPHEWSSSKHGFNGTENITMWKCCIIYQSSVRSHFHCVE